MVGAAHIAAGAAIGVATKNPWVAIPAALVTHYVLDMVPHHEYMPQGDHLTSLTKGQTGHMLFRAGADFTIGMLATAIITQFNIWALMTAIVAIIPDGLNSLGVLAMQSAETKPPSRLQRMFIAQRKFHRLIHFKKGPYDAPLWLPLLIQVLPMFILLWFVVRLVSG